MSGKPGANARTRNLVRLAEGHAVAHQPLGDVSREREALGRGGRHALGVELPTTVGKVARNGVQSRHLGAQRTSAQVEWVAGSDHFHSPLSARRTELTRAFRKLNVAL